MRGCEGVVVPSSSGPYAIAYAAVIPVFAGDLSPEALALDPGWPNQRTFLPPGMSTPARAHDFVHDCVVIGGGLSGLVAALSLQRSGARVAVLEADTRVGGRTVSLPLACCPSARVDHGGQWLGARQDAALALAKSFDLRLHPQYAEGRRLIQVGAQVRSYTGLIPPLSWASIIDTQVILWLTQLLGLLMLVLPLPASLRAWLLRWADGITVEELAQRRMWTGGGRALLRIVVQALFGAEPHEVSLLAFLRYVRASGGSLEEMTDMGEGSLQAWTIVGGAAQLSERAAAAFVAAGGLLVTERAVVALSLVGSPPGGGEPRVEVRCADGSALAATHAILALPPPAAARLSFTPALPAPRAGLLAEAAMGCIIKVRAACVG